MKEEGYNAEVGRYRMPKVRVRGRPPIGRL